jgi:hypothetical protein
MKLAQRELTHVGFCLNRFTRPMPVHTPIATAICTFTVALVLQSRCIYIALHLQPKGPFGFRARPQRATMAVCRACGLHRRWCWHD